MIDYEENRDAISIIGIQTLMDNVCHELAKRFNLYGSNGKPRKADAIETLANSACLTCLRQKFLGKQPLNSVDSFYKECHKLAVNVLVERLYWLFSKLGYNVEILTEAELGFGNADIVMKVSKLRLSLKHKAKVIIIEVKTGNSLSFSQLFRYMLSGESDSIIVWRIRKRQILIFNAECLKPLLAEFATMVYLRAKRLLSTPPTACTHKPTESHQPTQKELQNTLKEFGQGLVETLPYVIVAVLKELGLQNWEERLLDIKQT